MAKRRKLQRPSGRPQLKAKPQSKPIGGGGGGGGPKTPHSGVSQQQPKKKNQHKQHQHEQPTIPFGPHDRILLIGEGDLSFAASIVDHHGCTNVTATVLEKDHAELLAKYPAVDANIAVINRRPDSAAPSSGSGTASEDDDAQSDIESGDDDNDDEDHKKQVNNKLVYAVDATKLPSSIIRTPHDHILFNFPHVGGKSTDVNRQVRYNQELLVSFFQRALTSPSAPLARGGSIVVTLFEGEPYTLWNIRDLARHAGLEVDRSFRFQPDAYPGYRHARTLGVVRNKKGEEVEGWRGEDRLARSYVFVRKGEAQKATSKKRRRGDDDDDSSSDED